MFLYRAILLGVLLLGVGLANVRGQEAATQYPKLETRVDPTSGTVGDRFRLTVSAEAPNLDSLEMLSFIDAQTTWVLAADPEIEDVRHDGVRRREYVFEIVPFETGRVFVPEIAITYTADDGSSNTAFSQAVWVHVNSVLSGDGSASALRDIKPPVALSVPRTIVISGGLLLLVLLGALGWWLWRRYSRRVQRLFGRHLSPPERALKAIDDLEDEGLIEQKRFKEFYTRLVDVLRGYLQEAYGVHAADLTSNELLSEMDRLAEEVETHHLDDYRRAVARLVEVINEADMVKFARYLPSAAQSRRSVQAAKDVVTYTRHRFVTENDLEQPDKEGANSIDGMNRGAGMGSA